MNIERDQDRLLIQSDDSYSIDTLEMVANRLNWVLRCTNPSEEADADYSIIYKMTYYGPKPSIVESNGQSVVKMTLSCANEIMNKLWNGEIERW